MTALSVPKTGAWRPRDGRTDALSSCWRLIALLLPAAGAACASAVPSLGTDSPGDELYRFEASELKAASHRLDGAFWPRSAETGTPEQRVVLLEVQMHAKPGFKHRLGAQSFRFLQLHPQIALKHVEEEWSYPDSANEVQGISCSRLPA